MEDMEVKTTLEKMMLMNARGKRIPINGSIELLPLCNMNCDMCYVRLSKEEMNQKGRMRTTQEWLSLGEQMQKAGVLFLLFTGGEPLLHPGFKEIYLGFKKLGMIITINTNGTLIDEEWVEFFKKHRPRRLNVTLYGASKETYKDLCHYEKGYEKTLNAIKLLVDAGIDVKVGGTFTKANVHEVETFMNMEKELKAPLHCDTYMMPASRERNKPFNKESRLDPVEAAKAKVLIQKMDKKEEFKAYAKRMVTTIDSYIPSGNERINMYCNAGKCSFTINWQGEIRPCVMLENPSVSVFETPFIEAWEKVYKTCDTILLPQKCTSCKFRSICDICAASALLESGSYDEAPEYLCTYAESLYNFYREEIQND